VDDRSEEVFSIQPMVTLVPALTTFRAYPSSESWIRPAWSVRPGIWRVNPIGQ
jgi:hypothetical protein